MGPRGGLPSLWSPPRRVCVQPRRHPGQRRMTKWHQLGDPCCHPAPWYHHAPPRVCIHSSLVKPMTVLLPTLWAHAPFSNKEKLSQFTQLVLDGAGIKVRPAHPCTLPILILQLCKWVPCWVSQGPDLGRSWPLRTHWEWGSWLCRPFQQCLSAVKMTGARCCLHPSQILIPLIPNRSLHRLSLGVKCQQLLPLSPRKNQG